MLKTMTKKTFVPSRDVERMMGITTVAVHYLRKRGKLPFIKVGGEYLHDLDVVEVLVARRRTRLEKRLAIMSGAIA